MSPISKAYYDACLDIYRGSMAEHDRDQYLYEAQARALQPLQRRHGMMVFIRHLRRIRPVLRRIRERAEQDA